MSDYNDYAAEKASIDTYVSQGYVLTVVIEDLSGDRLDLNRRAVIGEKVSLLDAMLMPANIGTSCC